MRLAEKVVEEEDLLVVGEEGEHDQFEDSSPSPDPSEVLGTAAGFTAVSSLAAIPTVAVRPIVVFAAAIVIE